MGQLGGGVAVKPGLELCKGLTLSSYGWEGQKSTEDTGGVDSGQNRELEGLRRGPLSAGPARGFRILFINRKWGGSICLWAQGRADVREPYPRTVAVAVHWETAVLLGGHSGSVFSVTPST